MEAVKIVSFHSYESLVSYSNKIRDSVNNIKNEYIYIGALLNEVNDFKLYEYEGCRNIAEYCEKEFGFKKSFTYNLMNVQKRFCDKEGSMFSINPKYKDYDFSKLVLMCKMNEEQLHCCHPEYSVKSILTIKNGLFSSSDSTRVEKSEQTEHVIECTENEIESPFYVCDNYKVLYSEDIESLDLLFGMKCNLGDKFRCVFFKL